MDTKRIKTLRERQREIIAELHLLPENQLVLEAERMLEGTRQALIQKQKPLLKEITILGRKIKELKNDNTNNKKKAN